MKSQKVELFGKSIQMTTGLPSENELALMVKAGLNILFVGPHGVGKTQTVRNTCVSLGLSLGYYHTPTLDPYIDFIGVPYPSEAKDGTFDLLKSRQLKDAEVLFFDEINRADDRILNALFEIIQFRACNGTPFPQVRSVFAAINPSNDDYHVAEMDAALLDRFDAVVYVGPNYDKDIMKAEFGGDDKAERLAENLIAWTPNISEGYVSPRALTRIGNVFNATNHKLITYASVPMGVVYSRNELWGRLTAARDNKDYDAKDKISKAAASKVGFGTGKYTKDEFNRLKRDFIKNAKAPGFSASTWISELERYTTSEINSISCSAGSKSKLRTNINGCQGNQFLQEIVSVSKTNDKVLN